ncbi:hypothetical protein SAMN05216327_101227 [Dyadobacter sp. SG02]|uniref:hypothetical protein n=1 Tax=Dyadobacter sp. SG02 TaxID=1855291 RepID=UPI0008D2B3CB|nr:hypothetical protein [Dyadobacter sp. SG02]SEI39776.1 hypothetical protein SAMN05216327_101227 [Dyadobacter sp. SG02]
MARIDIEKLFAEDGGERYILSHYPDARQSFQNLTRKFKTREEKTASASLKRINGEWGVTDFGLDTKWRNAIMVCMLETGQDYGQALREVCAFYNYQDENQSYQPKPRYEERPMLPEEQEGASNWVPKELTVSEIRTILTDNAWFALGNNDDNRKERAQQLFALYHVKSLEYYTNIYQGKHLTTYSTDEYPIFYFDEGDFGKIYRPKAAHDKRFRYIGKKPNHYVHGLKQHQDFITERKKEELNKKAADAEFAPSPEEVAKEVERQDVKLPEIIACSGGSDALNVACLGYRVIWMNSEAESLSHDDIAAIYKISYKVYNLPDIDKTGKATGHALAEKFLNLFTIWLPEKILRVDSEGKATSKDLRDYLRTHNKRDFDQLIKTALPYRFWDQEYQYDDEGNKKMKFGRPLVQYKFNHVQAYNFLAKSGFARFKSERDKEGFFYVRVVGNKVCKIEAQEIKGYLHSFLNDRWLYDEMVTQDLLNSMFSTNQLSISNLANLPLLDLDFKSFGPDYQYMFFPNCTWKITGKGIEETKGFQSDKYVWEDKMITFPVKDKSIPRVKKLDNMFRIERKDTGYHIDILNNECMFFRFLINTARVHWRKELEERQTLWLTHDSAKKREEYCEAHGLTDAEAELFFKQRSLEEQDQYIQDNRFSIAGQLLTEVEKGEQMQHLVNRIYTIGYMLHRYKDPSRAWCVWAMDNKLSEAMGDDAKSNGGSGKSLTGKVLKWIWRYNVSFSGRNPLLTKNPHIYDKVTRHTDLIIVDDCYEFLDFGFFFSDITGDMNPNPKQTQSYSITFDESPKFWFDSNFGDRDFSESTQRRKLVTSFSDYYHENNGSYKETRQPTDDFEGRRMFYDFTTDDWNRMFNFLAQCLNFYLSCPEKVKPPMNNIQKRNLLSSMGGRFFEWAETYFGIESNRLDNPVCKREAKEDYMNNERIRDLSTQKFTEYCKKYAAYHGYDYNPQELRNSQDRIIREFFGKKEEAIYFRTKTSAPLASDSEVKYPDPNPGIDFSPRPPDAEMDF